MLSVDLWMHDRTTFTLSHCWGAKKIKDEGHISSRDLWCEFYMKFTTLFLELLVLILSFSVFLNLPCLLVFTLNKNTIKSGMRFTQQTRSYLSAIKDKTKNYEIHLCGNLVEFSFLQIILVFHFKGSMTQLQSLQISMKFLLQVASDTRRILWKF